MTERLIDAVCPHCGRVGTTVRVVLHEDGYTKLSRRCTDCGGECIHTFDHDWLSVAKNKKLQADNEHLTNAVALVSERVRQLSEERDYAWGEVEKLRDDAMRYRWLRKQKALRLVSNEVIWKRENGENFRASHVLSANDTRYGVYETLDETIDEAMRGESP